MLTEETRPLLDAAAASKQGLFSCKSAKSVFYWMASVVLIIATCSIIVYWYSSVGSATNGSNHKLVEGSDISSYVLSATTLVVDKYLDDEISGTFVVGDSKYNWKSMITDVSEAIHFESFSITHNHDKEDTITYVLPTKTVVVSSEIEIDDETRIAIEQFLTTEHSEHFVQFSVKLGSLGYIGSECNLVRNIHQAGKWMLKSMTEENQLRLQSAYLQEEVRRANDVISASRELGHWPKDIEEMMGTKSLSTSILSATSRSLLGNCVMESKCDNECFGMCGQGCDCWSWVCGDCDCWMGCYQHDEYCSCDCMMAYCCLNIFWVECDGSDEC
jgi:hypothetical protein